MKNLAFQILSDSEVEVLERIPHNPPCYTDTFTDEDFSTEWWGAREAVRQTILLFGHEWLLSSKVGDFMVSPSRGDSRWIYITFVSTRLWRPEFVRAVSEVLASFPHDYRVGCLTALDDAEMLDNPLVYLVISSRAVFGHVTPYSHTGALHRFGFPARALSRYLRETS